MQALLFLSKLKIRLSNSKKICVICSIESSLKRMENIFYFALKGICRPQDSLVFVTIFWSYFWKNSLIRKIRLISKFMTSQPSLQAIPIHILPNISQNKGDQTMKFGQLKEHNKRNIFIPKLCGK